MTEGNESAYPLEETNEACSISRGLTKRKLFAAMAMEGLLAGGRLNPEDNAFYALANADSLIERLNVTNPD